MFNRRTCKAFIIKTIRKTEVHTSQDSYGATLLHKLLEDGKLHSVYFMSKKTSEAEKKYSSYELEALTVVEALNRFRIYLLGKTFKIITDCAAFQQTKSIKKHKKDATNSKMGSSLRRIQLHY